MFRFRGQEGEAHDLSSTNFEAVPGATFLLGLNLKGLWYQVGCPKVYVQNVKIYPKCEPRCPPLFSLGKTETWAKGEKTCLDKI